MQCLNFVLVPKIKHLMMKIPLETSGSQWYKENFFQDSVKQSNIATVRYSTWEIC